MMVRSEGGNSYAKRRDRLQARIGDRDVDAFVVTQLSNVRYLSGFSGSHAILVLRPDGGTIISDGRYQQQIASEVTGLEVEIQGTRQDLTALTDVLKAHTQKSARIGVEASDVSQARYQALSKNVTPRTLVPVLGVVEALRRVKDEGEIDLVRQALVMAEESIRSAWQTVREGMTERELAHEIEHQMWLRGAEKESFDSLVLFGERSSLPHGKPGERPLRPGDIVLTDIGCLLRGYCSDITRTCCFRSVPDEFEEAYEAVREAVGLAEEGLTAGMTCRDADALARDSLTSTGRGDLFIHGTGHGVGLDIHEAPRLSKMSEETLSANELVTVEPGIYIEGWGGIRIEDMVVVRDGGCERLNQDSTELVIL